MLNGPLTPSQARKEECPSEAAPLALSRAGSES